MSMRRGQIFQFGKFQIDAPARTLRREEATVKINSRAFDVLLYLVQNPGRVLTRDELLKSAWADACVDESSLAQNISLLRRALEEKPGDNSYIVTLPGRGYQFVAAVQVVASQVVASEDGSTLPEAATAGRSNSSGFIVQKHTVETSVITSKEEKEQVRSPIFRIRLPRRAVVAVAAMALSAGGYFYFHRPPPKLTDKDTIVLADFSNSTGDAIFDDTLKTALDVSLRQSPFLNVLSDREIAKTLEQTTRPADTKLTPELAREICQRAGSKAYIDGAIGSLGSKYVLELKAVNCKSGDTLAEQQMTASTKEKVLNTLGKAASKLRGELGESLATVQKFDVPLAEATIPSLDALKAFSVGRKANTEKGFATTIPYYQRAIELDPDFAMGYRAVGGDYA